MVGDVYHFVSLHFGISPTIISPRINFHHEEDKMRQEK